MSRGRGRNIPTLSPLFQRGCNGVLRKQGEIALFCETHFYLNYGKQNHIKFVKKKPRDENF